MVGRNHMHRHPESSRGFHDGLRPVLHRGPRPLPLRHASLEEELDMQHRDIQRILAENRHIVEENVSIQREVDAIRDQIHELDRVVPKIRAEKEAHAKELTERGRKLEAELRAVEPLRSEVHNLRAEAKQLNALREELSAQVQNLNKDITKLQSENQQQSAMRADVDGMHKELMEARRAFEYERKANEEQVEQKQTMEKNLISIAREIEKLRAELMNGRSHGFGTSTTMSGGYGMLNGSPEMRYSGGGGGGYGAGGAWGSYDSSHGRR